MVRFKKNIHTIYFFSTQQYILRFNVKMCNSFGVQVLQSGQDLAHAYLRLDFSQRTVLVENGL